MADYGTLLVRTTTASGAYPVSDVNVNITGVSEIGKGTKISVLTNETGITQPILLPAPPRSQSLSPDSDGEAYTKYDVEIYKEGYYRKKLFDVAIFPGIVSVLPVNMIPVTPYNQEENKPKDNENAIITENENL